jgi:hypothetical protein
MSMKITKTSPLNYHFEIDGIHAKLVLVIIFLAFFVVGYIFGAA